MIALQLIRQLAAMSTPADEFAAFTAGHPDVVPVPTLEDWEDELSSDRMEDDARALWRMIDAARQCLRDHASAEAAALATLDAPIGVQLTRQEFGEAAARIVQSPWGQRR